MKKILFLICLLFLSSEVLAQSNISKICFQRDDFIYVQDTATKQAKRVVRGVDPFMSPDGKQIAYTENLNTNTPNRIVKVIDLATNKTRSFKSLAKFTHYGPVWSPDGKWIALHVFREEGNEFNWVIGLVNPETGEWKNLTANIKGDVFLSSWTADSQSVIGHNLDEVYQVDLNGKEIKRLKVETVAGGNDIDSSNLFFLSSDGKQLIFNASIPEDADPEDLVVAIFSYDFETKKVKRLTPLTIVATNPNMLPSGEITFNGYPAKSRKGTYKLYKMPLAGSAKPELLLANASEGSFAIQ